MNKNILLNHKEITTVLINLMCVKLFFTFPKKLIVNSGNAAWIQIIYVTVIAFALLYINIRAYKGCSNKNIIELSEKTGGKPLKIVVGILVIFTLFLNFSTVIRSYPNMVKTVLLPETPYEAIFLIYAAATGVAAYVGFESVARIHAVFIPTVLVIMIAFFVFLIPHVKVYNIFPLFGNGFSALFGKGLFGIEFFADILALNLILPNVKNAEEAEKSAVKAIFISAGAALMIVLSYGMIYPYPASEKFIIPTYQLTRLVEIGDFFQRFEAFFEFVWSIAVFLYSAFYLCLICRTFAEFFELKFEKPIVFPTIFAAVAVAAEKNYGISENNFVITSVVLGVSFVLPPVLALIYRLKRRCKKDITV